MTDNNTPNTNQQQTTPPEGNGAAGKMFTQDEVNSIVKDRLARERAKGQTSTTTEDMDAEKAQLEAGRKQLQEERNTFGCERYCKENGLDPKLVELIGSRDPEEFKATAEALRKVFAAAETASAAPAAVRLNSGMEHGSTGNFGSEPDGAQFFKPSGTY